MNFNDIDKKEMKVRNHYERAYKVILKKDLKPEEIEMLWQNLRKMIDTEFFYDKSKS